MRGITSRFVMLIASAAIAPLVIYGWVSITNLRAGTRESVNQGNLRVADQVAERLKLYVESNARILRSVGQELTATNLAEWQQSRILKNHVLEFSEFREISLFDPTGRVIATSRIGPPEVRLPSSSAHTAQRVNVAPIFQDDDNLPATDLSISVGVESTVEGRLVARLSLEELWRFVDTVRVGKQGYALVLSRDQHGHRVVAHGDPEAKHLVAVSVDRQRQPVVELVQRRADERQFTDTYDAADGRQKVAAVARIPEIDWTVVVEQPADEAYAVTTALQRQLFVAIALALLGTIVLGWIWARSFITRIFALKRATQAIAAGHLDERVTIGGEDEIRQLGDAFNTMADRLVELQEDVRKQERQVMFGRIAAGLVHDLSHPIQTIGNSCKLIVRMFDDHEYRTIFKETVDRELAIVKNVLEGLLNIARPKPLERFPLDVNRSIAETVASMQHHAETAGVTLRTNLSPEPAFIEADLFALGRVYRNLIVNAIQATAPGGTIVVESDALADRVQVRVRDTGCGIPAERLTAIFEDFMTTKRRGLGLGLAISRKIVDQLGGTISVASDVGKGTTFVLDFPRTHEQPMLAAG